MSIRERSAVDRFAGVFMKVLVGSAVAVVLWPLLFTTLVQRRSGTPMPHCQSSLNQIGKAIKTYLSDWDDHYPTNRPFLPDGTLGPVSNSVKLSTVGVDETGKPYRGEHGSPWVEGLYNYMEPIREQDAESSVWKCDKIDGYPPTSKSAAVSYAFNRNLVEKHEGVVRYGANLMLAREMDRLVDSTLRPINDSCTKDHPPVSALLTDSERDLGLTKHVLHGNGSNVLFADGHVKHILGSAVQDEPKWDPKTKTWTNADGSVHISP